MSTTMLRFPHGGGCRPYVIASINIEDTGVSAVNASGIVVGWVPTSNSTSRARVAEALMDCLDSGKRFVQPNWSELLRVED